MLLCGYLRGRMQRTAQPWTVGLPAALMQLARVYAGGEAGSRAFRGLSRANAQMIAGKVNTVKSIAIDTYGRAGDIASEALDIVKGVRDTALVRGLVGLFHRPAEQPDARDV